MESLIKRISYLIQPPEKNCQWEFHEIFNLEELQKIQDAFAAATNVASIITDIEGNPITRPSNFCRLCTEVIEESITQSYLGGRLLDGGTSIYIGDQHIANWYIGQVLDDEPKEEEILAYAREIGADEEEFKRALAEVPRMSKEQFEKVCQALFQIAKQISTLAIQRVEKIHLAYHDILTNLPNRALFYDQLSSGIAQAKDKGKMSAVLFLDLDRFKLVNDTLGHAVGDKLLQAVSQRLRECIRSVDMVARLGGDEFTIILPQIKGEEDVIEICHKIKEILRPSFSLEGQDVYITTSIGISLYPGDGADPEILLKNADTALYRAKEKGRNNYQFYIPAMNAKAFHLLTMESKLRQGLEREEFILYYQPLIDLKTKGVVGMEALVRWQHSQMGLVSPLEFIPLAEECGLIIPLGEWVLRTACQQNKAWQEEGLPPLKVAVNLSARQFQQDNLVELVLKILEETGLDPQWLELEITENVAMLDIDFTIKVLMSLREKGVQIAIDDFGTGYSSLGYLKNFPISTLKIDQSFIGSLAEGNSDGAITTAMITLAHNLNLKVTAEGVETEEQLSFLQEQQCDSLQGYLFSKPLPPKLFEQLLRGGGKFG